MARKLRKINIRPGVSVLSVLKHLNYKPWFALAEFVDNSVQSFLQNKETLQQDCVRVSIEIDPKDGGYITIRDNAGGIALADFPRAFRPAEIPPNSSGLSEFGMGMKSAACWFAPEWTVRTSAFDDKVGREVRFNIDKIVNDQLEDLKVIQFKADPSDHYTELKIEDLHHIPVKKTIGKIKSHLTDIYRVFLRDGTLQLIFNGEQLIYSEPEILTAEFYKEKSGEEILWKKEIEFEFGPGLEAKGFSGILKTGKSSGAGFALFRRGRLIEGVGDEGYRPEFIFGKPNSYRSQRIFGELHLVGFQVSHTKDGFQWNTYEDEFLNKLKERLDASPLPLLDQAEGYRVRRSPSELRPGCDLAIDNTAAAVRTQVPAVAENLANAGKVIETPKVLEPVIDGPLRQIDFEFRGEMWEIVIELSPDPAVSNWLEISDSILSQTDNPDLRRLGIRIALNHPFMVQFTNTSVESIEPLIRMGVALAISETLARDAGVKMAATVRRNLNELLLKALCDE